MLTRAQQIALGLCAVSMILYGPLTRDAQAQEQTGELSAGLPVVQASTAELMAREPAPNVVAGASSDGAGTNLSVGANFTAITLQEASVFPPDGHIAAGPTQLLVSTNGRLRSFAKATGARDNVMDLAPNTFFSLIKAGGDVFGGRVRFDSFSNRWFVTMRTNAAPGRVVIAFSSGSTITASTVWSFSGFDNTSFAPGTCAIDGPTFGLDASALYFGVNQFCDGSYAGTSAFVVRKASLIAGTLALTRFDNLTTTPAGEGFYSPMAVDSMDGSSAFGYFIGVDNASFGRLVLRRIANPGGTTAGSVTMSSNILIDVAPTALPVLVPHLGNTGEANGQLSGGDDRLSSASLRGGRIWTAHAIRVNDAGAAGTSRNGVRWYELGSVDSTPALLQSDTMYSTSGAGTSYWNPSIAITSQQRAVIGFSAAGSAEYANAGVAERLSTDAANTFGAPTLYTSASSPYNPAADPGSPSGRLWGSYSATVTDACDDTTVWTLQQYTNAANSYALQVAKLQVASPPVPVSALPSAVPHGQSSIDVTITTNGAGAFFDTGAGFACRLSATIPGVTVNRVTIASPTTLVLNISTAEAIPGAKTVTIVNPDGQSVTSGELLTVSEGSIPTLNLDSPSEQATVGLTFSVAGWAIDRAATSGTGVDSVHIYAFPVTGPGVYGGAIFLGVAAYGSPRGDIGGVFGNQYINSGFSLTATGLASGAYLVRVFAHSTVVNAFTGILSTAVTVQGPVPAPHMAMDAPASNSTQNPNFTIAGWALDRGSLTDTGVSGVHVYAFPLTNGSVGAAQFLGVASYGAARGDLGAIFGEQFTNCGYSLAANLSPGMYRIVAYAHSTVANAFSQSRAVDITVDVPQTSPAMSIDGPQTNSTVSRPFNIAGWAIDRGASSGAGVDAIHVYAYPVGGGNPILVGAGAYGSSRPDLGAFFGAQFINAGYSLSVSASELPQGTYDLTVFARSTVTNTFNQLRTIRLTVN